MFSPDEKIEKKQHILSVVNDWENRDYICGGVNIMGPVESILRHSLGDEGEKFNILPVLLMKVGKQDCVKPDIIFTLILQKA